MENIHLIPATEICTYHEVDYTFISSLNEAGLVELTVIDQTAYIPAADMQKLERMIRLHDELEINLPGIEAISHLLERIERMHEELRVLRNKHN